MPIEVNRAPVLTLWAAVVAEQLGHPPETALTLGRAVAGYAARVKARNIGREERKGDRDIDTPGLAVPHITAPVLLLGKTIRLLPNADGELRAADGDLAADPVAVQRYLAKAFGERLAEVREAMEELARRYAPAELNRIGFNQWVVCHAEPGRLLGSSAIACSPSCLNSGSTAGRAARARLVIAAPDGGSSMPTTSPGNCTGPKSGGAGGPRLTAAAPRCRRRSRHRAAPGRRSASAARCGTVPPGRGQRAPACRRTRRRQTQPAAMP